MRKLTGHELDKEQAQAEKDQAAKVEKPKADRWVPYDGNLEPATLAVKDRVFKEGDGTLRSFKETVVNSEGRPKYAIVGQDLLEWRCGARGVKRRLVITFKNSFQDTPGGRTNKNRQKSFLAMLRSKGIYPGMPIPDLEDRKKLQEEKAKA